MGNLLPISSPRPVLAVGGIIRNDVSADITSLVFTEKTGELEVTLNNWSPPSFKYSDLPLLQPQTKVALYMGEVKEGNAPLFSGHIVRFAPAFPEGAPPTLTIFATQANQVTSQGQMAVQWGSELHEFLPILEGHAIRCTGTVDGNSSLHKGMALLVSGVGTAFSRRYAVESTIHTFDLSTGYRTRFNAGG